jgi:hypothetical protein
MSPRPIARSPDLTRLRNEGYDIEVRGGYLLVRDVPYVTAAREVKRGILISTLEMDAERTVKPTTHVAYWTGEHPCHSDGGKIRSIENGSAAQDFGNGIRADFTFSAKSDYRDYFHKMTTYIGRITGEARVIDPNADARTFPAVRAEDEDGPFQYEDTATSRAGIGAANAKVAGLKIGIAGLGGTGAYILDFVAKTAVAQIHLFDGDVFSQHNAFRAPGAASLEELEKKPQKVARFAEIYGRMHRGIIPHDAYLSEANLSLLDGLDFVFVCIDRGPLKRLVIERLVANRTPFIEVGMGVMIEEGELGGIVRATTSTPETRAQAEPHISYAEDTGEVNEYATNIQIAELNASNAVMAVVRWKKHFGAIRDSRKNFNEAYLIASGEIAAEGLE